MEKTMENRVEKYKLNAKKAYEFAAGLRIENADKNKTKRVYGKKPGRPSLSLINKLSADEQKVFIENCEFGFRYAKLSNSRLEKEVEYELLSSVSGVKIKWAIEYCNLFEISLPSCLHNKILMQTVLPEGKNNLNWRERYQSGVVERKQKKYLKLFQDQKKSFKIYLEGLMKNNNLTEDNTIKELIESMC
jgi:hypothetical protein